MQNIRAMAARSVVAGLLLLLPFVSGQVLTQYDNPACGKTFASLNASDFGSAVTQNIIKNSTGKAPPELDIGVSVYLQPSSNTVLQTTWGDANGANLSDTSQLTYDICAFALVGLSDNANNLGRNDTGDCETALGEDCWNYITLNAGSYAQDLLGGDPPPPQNLTQVCQDFADKFTRNVLGDGNPFCKDVLVNGSEITLPTPLTGPGIQLSENNNCSATDTATNKTYVPIIQQSIFPDGGGVEGLYDSLVNNLITLLVVYIPPANRSASGTGITHAVADLLCLRPARDITSDSQQPPPLPAGTPWPTGAQSSGGVLSGGAIAGIVIGAIVAIAIPIGVGIFFWLKRKKRVSQAEAGKGPFADNGGMTEARHSIAGGELPADNKVLELDGGLLQEMGSDEKMAEAPDSPTPVAELPANELGEKHD